MQSPVDIRLDNLSVDFDGHFQLRDVSWTIACGQHWLIGGPNGAGKSALAAVLSGVGDVTAGSKAELIASELKKDDADILDVISEGTPVAEIIERDTVDRELANQLIEQFGLTPLLDRAFRKLSTGETRKVMLVRALASDPALLVLDEPFDGLDANTHQMLMQHLKSIVEKVPTVMVLNRVDERPDFISHIAWVDEGRLSHTVVCEDKAAMAELDQLLHLKHSNISLPETDPIDRLPALDPSKPLVNLNKVSVKYADNLVFENIDWRLGN